MKRPPNLVKTSLVALALSTTTLSANAAELVWARYGDIDSLDPAYAPGTGTPEIGGLTTSQAMQLIRGLRGLNIVGADLVEVSPPYDPSGNTALVAANIFFEMLCIMPGVAYR